MNNTAYIFTVEQLDTDRCKSTIRNERRFDTEQEALKAFDNYDIANEFRIYTKTEGRASMEGCSIEAIVVPATVDEDGDIIEYDNLNEINCKTYSWDDFIEA